ncbi:MAG: phycobilisome protein [Oscillatoriales cyanobacterium]|nr:MAG: phycobilisome protein [Oscillatoriales cyanobacterium]TAD94101.1 MAG: phycobilisome protein [Oscillatoriales cyanobacterium]TAE04687.1 MAG: phycobilisome protein [Oscillatoriales cyanobacterium]TAF02907.1 MAG: phycobilisome protein [Oscillatoriales cyanobacterium]TAF46251.1 MAG: phycobilisome protein [Oscillatoriales cyanobacterium]
MTMQLSERAKELIPKARIVSFATWNNLYSDEVIAIFQAADNRGQYLTDADLERIQNLVSDNSLMVAQAKLLREQAPDLVANARAKVLAEFPNIAEPGNDLYPPARAEACWRDFWHFLRSVTYGVAGKNPEFLSQEGLKNMELLYQELGVPVPAMLCGLEQLKTVSLQQFSSEEQDLLGLNFDHLISALKQFSQA